MAVYGVERSALLGLDLLRRDPRGLADQMAYRALLLTEQRGHPPPDVRAQGDPEVEQARSNALLLGTDSTLDHLAYDAIPGASPDALATLVVGTAADAYHTILDFADPNAPCAPALQALADGVLAIWSHKLISDEDHELLIGPALAYLAASPLRPETADFPPQTPAVRALIRHAQQLTPEDFHRLDGSTAAGGAAWESAMDEAAHAASTAGRCRPVAAAQFGALAVIGETADRLGINLAALVAAATSLAGAVQAVMTRDMTPSAAVGNLLHDWRRAPSAVGPASP